MNKEGILAMEVGLELDRLVEEVIFNHKEAKIIEMYSSVWVGNIPSPFYSTDISAAWPIVVEMGVALIPLNNKDWACCKASYIYHMGIGQDHYADPNIVICRAAPEAICKAALLAKLEGGK